MCILNLTSSEKSEKNYEAILGKQADRWMDRTEYIGPFYRASGQK